MQENSEYYFNYSASFRIIGEDLPFDEIERTLRLSATHKHRKNDTIGGSAKKFIDDRWVLESPLSEERKLNEHLGWLWENLSAHKDYLIQLRDKHHIDIFVGYRSDCSHCGTVISPESMKICHELQVPLELSIVIT